ncbi:DUF4912 domain-containing protein [Bacillota bacterium Lsc_1132]
MLEEMIKRRRSGMSFREIAKELNTATGKVHYRLRKRLRSQEQNDQVIVNNPLKTFTPELKMKRVSDQKISLRWHAVELPKKVVKHCFQSDFDELVQVIRIYDVTKIRFNGSNAHHYHELAVPYSREYWHVKGLLPNRNYIAELGVKLSEDDFFPILRSNLVQLGPESDRLEVLDREQNNGNPPAWLDHVSTYSFYQNLPSIEMESKND